MAKTKDLNKHHITFDDIAPIIESLKHIPLFDIEQQGESFLGKPIYSIEIGNGPRRVLFWSQMHGDEPTATAALMDLFRYMQQPEQHDWLSSWQHKLTLKFIPMLNPDGAEVCQRENAQGIDINRDALQLQTPEGRLLLSVAESFQPQFGFNLHDQNREYAVANTMKPATISLLAPAYNEAREINDSRGNAMRLIGDLIPTIESKVPGQLARYDDEYSKRSFGDTFSKMGISTILVESGGNYNDPNRQTAREINLHLYIAAINSITNRTFEKQTLEAYHSIPLNKEGGMHDLVIRNLTINSLNSYQTDLAIDWPRGSDKQAQVSVIGDLSGIAGYQFFDASGFHLMEGKPYTLNCNAPLNLDVETYFELLEQGYNHFAGPESALHVDTPTPVVLNQAMLHDNRPTLHKSATFYMQNEEGKWIAVVDGHFFELANTKCNTQ